MTEYNYGKGFTPPPSPGNVLPDSGIPGIKGQLPMQGISAVKPSENLIDTTRVTPAEAKMLQDAGIKPGEPVPANIAQLFEEIQKQ